MKASELKLRITSVANDLVDTYYGENTLIDNLANSTLKVLIKVNMDKMDDMLDLFKNKEGEIDAESVINAYVEKISDDGIPFDLKDYIKSDFVRGLLPNKSLIIDKNDILKIIKDD